MRVSDSSVGGGAGQFHTTRWALEAFVGMGKSRPEASNEEAAKALNVVSTVKTLIHRLRKQYLAIVREEVARTVSNPAEIEGEIRALCDALIAAEGRLRPRKLILEDLSRGVKSLIGAYRRRPLLSRATEVAVRQQDGDKRCCPTS